MNQRKSELQYIP